MRFILPTLTTAFAAFLLASCGGTSSQDGSTTEVAQDTTAEPIVYLEGLYATSTRLPLRQYGIGNLFDGNAGTIWSTTQGAGPDEGFILYFSTKQYIHDLSLLPLSDTTDMATVKGVTVYVDGHSIGYFNPANAINVDTEVSSIFVKIGETNQSSTEEVPGENSDEALSVERFSKDFAVGFSGIRITNKEGDVVVNPPVSVEGTVVASSVLKPASAYVETQLFDSRKEFVWAEGSKGGGENETLTFTFKDELTISSLKIWNGYQRSQKHFDSNARVKVFEIGLKDGTKTKYTLQDSMDPQQVNLESPLKGKEIILTVVEVYPGTSYKDLVLSEMIFYDGSTPMAIRDDKADTRVQSLISETKGSVLETYLDRRLHNQVAYSYYTSDRSLVLRSNKTFVMYDHAVSQDDAKQEDKEVVADGNWEIVELKEDYAKVRIFGKLFNLSETVEYYKGNTSTEIVKIFQDNLHITPEEIKGEKYVESFHHQSSGEGSAQ